MASSFLESLFGSKRPSETISLFKDNPYRRSETETAAGASQKDSHQGDAADGGGKDSKQKKQKRKKELSSSAELKDGGVGVKEVHSSAELVAQGPILSPKKGKDKKLFRSLSVKENGAGKSSSKPAETKNVYSAKKAVESPGTTKETAGGLGSDRKFLKSPSASLSRKPRGEISLGLLENREIKKRKKHAEVNELVAEPEMEGKKKLKSLESERGRATEGKDRTKLLLKKNNGEGAMKDEDGEGPEDDVEGGVSEEEKLKRTIFVGNLPKGLKRKAVARLFVSFGEVESVRLRSVPITETKLPRKAAIMTGHLSESRSSMNAYVVFKSEDAANAALVQNMKEVDGKHVRVDLATPRGGAGGAQGSSVEYDRSRSVFIGNLPFDVEEEELLQVVGGRDAGEELRGSIEAVRIVRDRHTNVGRGIAFVLFKAKGAMRAALWLNGQATLRGRELRITRIALSAPSKGNVASKYSTGSYGNAGGRGGSGMRDFDNSQPENRTRAKKRPAVAERKAAMAQLKSGVAQPTPVERKKKKSVVGGKGPKKAGMKKRKGDGRKK